MDVVEVLEQPDYYILLDAFFFFALYIFSFSYEGDLLLKQKNHLDMSHSDLIICVLNVVFKAKEKIFTKVTGAENKIYKHRS